MGTLSILNNPSAINGQHQLNLNNLSLNRTLQRMASGVRINTGADDAAGLQIADSLRANVYGLNQAVRNANDGISYLQIADGALTEVTNLLTRMVTLASQAATETVDQSGRDALNNEFQTIQAEIARIARDTNFNGTPLFDYARRNTPNGFEDTLDVFVGDLSMSSYIMIDLGYITIDPTGQKIDNFNFVGGLNGVDLLTRTNAANAFDNIKESLNAVAIMRGDIGAGMNRLQAAVSVMQAQSRNTLSAESAIRDANMAEEITNMTKYQILAQTGISALAHSNTNSQTVLRLLQ